MTYINLEQYGFTNTSTEGNAASPSGTRTLPIAANYILKDRGQVFMGKPSGKTLPGLSSTASPDLLSWVPTADSTKNYIPSLWFGEILIGMGLHHPLYIFGPQGSGKTAGVKYVASKLQLPLYEITGHSRLEFPELCGSYHLVNGSMVWSDGPLARAMRNGGIFLLNEQSLLDPATAAGLNTILDGSPLYIPELNESVPPHPHFFYIATDNTNGNGDATGLYQGTLQQSGALMSRFQLIEANYLAREAEDRILRDRCPSLADTHRNIILQFAEEVRQSFTSSDASSLSITMSPRDMIRWGLLINEYAPLTKQGINVMDYALDRAFAFRATETDRTVLHEFLQRITGMAQDTTTKKK